MPLGTMHNLVIMFYLERWSLIFCRSSSSRWPRIRSVWVWIRTWKLWIGQRKVCPDPMTVILWVQVIGIELDFVKDDCETILPFWITLLVQQWSNHCSINWHSLSREDKSQSRYNLSKLWRMGLNFFFLDESCLKQLNVLLFKMNAVPRSNYLLQMCHVLQL